MRVLLVQGLDEVVVSGAGPELRVRAVPGEGMRVNQGPLVARWRAPLSKAPVAVRAGGRVFSVRGVVEVLALYGAETDGPSGLAVVNEVPLERYLGGILGREMYGSWGPGALRAQAVASRTYALHQREVHQDGHWHLSAGTRSQVYAGVDAESNPVEAALDATRGEILVQGGRPILAVFHSSSGGQTASAEEVWGESLEYLRSVPVEDEWDSPDSYWRVRVTRGTLGRAVASLGTDIGPVLDVDVQERTESGRVARVRLVGERGKVSVTGRQLRTALGESKLKSTLFELREDEAGFVFVGSGNGHGVGMSQWGARAMARRGDDYRKILGTFYPGAEIARLGQAAR
jgi:stage II sporulation protein D